MADSFSHADAPVDLLIIGTGMAGIGLARELRRLGDTRSITLVSVGSADEYSKPLLSTGFGKRLTPEKLAKKSAASVANELDATLWPNTRVVALDGDRRRVTLEDGEYVGFETLVLATGAGPRNAFDIPSGLAERFFSVNDLDDYRRFYTALAPEPARVAVVGAGLVGCEFANDLLVGGHQVTLIAPETTPLPRLLPATLGQALGRAFEAGGIELALGRTVSRIAAGEHDDIVLSLDSDDTHHVDVVLMATGLTPRSALAREAGISVSESGIRVDRTLATSHAGIYALGDVACIDGVNAMYVPPLQASVKALAATLTGQPTRVRLGAWPVVVKTPLLPVVAYPPVAPVAQWRIEGEGDTFTALAEDKDGQLVGFALTGGAVKRKVELSRAVPALLG
ncbi:FAD-dependent oxidoreductase [Halomonas sp. PAMB 3232]|uniref:NAD(P)/FAD-dependent oxidoreductase n=1 Tax=Halomonas sp. PAMB 3232 TaxID=3075221 RepID=UPI0028A0D66E|nr:FAD-dependent oxidoreductase [Halomonas sp. PAMB 3232]WNL39014.1 FAD-dependent oxidoreductase [Halomonas sp. PAMB 3232]